MAVEGGGSAHEVRTWIAAFASLHISMSFTAALAEQSANIVEIYHNRAGSHLSLGEVQVDVTLETRGREHVQELIAALGK